MGDNYIIKTKSPLGYIVVCSSDTWYNHITDGHPIMHGQEQNVLSTIENPEIIHVSSHNPKSHVYFKSTPYQPHGKEKTMYTKVIVKNNIEYSEVISAWPQNTMTGGIGGVIYVKPKL